MSKEFEYTSNSVLDATFRHDSDTIITYFYLRLARNGQDLATLLEQRNKKEQTTHTEFADTPRMLREIVEYGYENRAIDEKAYGLALLQGMLLAVELLESMAFEEGLSQRTLRENMLAGRRMTRDFAIGEDADLNDMLRIIADALVRKGTDRYESIPADTGYHNLLAELIVLMDMDEDQAEAFKAGFGQLFVNGSEGLARMQAERDIQGVLKRLPEVNNGLDRELMLMADRAIDTHDTGETE